MLQAQMFENLLKALKIKEVNILAHDLGDTVAMEMLARHVGNYYVWEQVFLSLIDVIILHNYSISSSR